MGLEVFYMLPFFSLSLPVLQKKAKKQKKKINRATSSPLQASILYPL